MAGRRADGAAAGSHQPPSLQPRQPAPRRTGVAAAANDVAFRRTWDLDDYAARAEEREHERTGGPSARSSALPAPRDTLKARSHRLELEAQVGKTVAVVLDPSNKAAAGGFYCDICDCSLKDSKAYLDHINGRKHQRNLGMSMSVERSTLDDVRARIEAVQQRRREPPRPFSLTDAVGAREAAERARREQRKRARLEPRPSAEPSQPPDGADDDDMARTMGFGTFASTKQPS